MPSSLWLYRLDALRGLCRARWLSCWGLVVGAGAQVHPGGLVRHEPGCSLGEGSVLYRRVRLLVTQGGRFCIGHNCHVAPDAYLLVGAQVLTIGNDVAIGPGLMLFCESNDVATEALFREQYTRANVSIGNNVFIGARVSVLPGSVIEDGVAVAAHSVVKGRLASGWLYGGCPARPLRRLSLAASASV